MKPFPVKSGLQLFLLLLVCLLLAPCGGSSAGEDTSPPEALFRVSRIRPDVRSRLSGFGEVLEFDTDSALIRTTPRRAELLAEAGAEITRVFAPTSLSAPPVPSRVITKSGAEEPVIREIIDLVDRDDLYRVMGDLSGENQVTIGGVERRILTRNSYQTEGISWATEYAFERLEGLGLAAEYHDYNWNGNNWRNLVAEQPGSVNPEQIYIICAHIDNLPTGPAAPGADDNASGSTAVLAAAGILSGYNFGNTVRYVLFTGEEQGLIGSYYYVQDALAAGDSIAGALNFDMIAYDGDNDGVMEIYSGTTEASNLIGDIFLDTVEVYGLDLDPVYYRTDPSWSDQYRFWQADYPAMVAIESWDDFNPNYHSLGDTLSNCNLDYMTEIVRAGVGTLARLAVPVPALSERGDYNGDGTSELAVFRPASGLWAARGVTRVYFGRSGDLPVPGDYRGDGTTIPAVFRPEGGLWAVRGWSRLYFGGAGDRPVPGVYGPGDAWVPGVFRPSTGLWAVRSLTRAYFGGFGDLPVPGDYGGSGRWHLGIYRPGSGLWAIRGLTRFYFGSGSPVPADYGGEGTSRSAVFEAGGRWRVRGLSVFTYGAGGDLAVPSGYRGDRLDRPAVFRPESGLWAVRGLTRAYFGTAGDIPVSR
jgi:hypothetical protein